MIAQLKVMQLAKALKVKNGLNGSVMRIAALKRYAYG